MVILKKSRGEWQGEFCSLVYRYDEKGDSLFSIDKAVTLYAPKSGWESLISRLFALDILSLPDYQRIPNCTQGADGDAVIVEVATRKLYRIYSYQEPNMHKTRVLEAGKMEAILELIEGEFGFSRLRYF